ncbi:MAG: ABC transporter substrate-binding protein [Clostridia bacterium]|nr:ABC transporter substrate-binding protein [Clostridia bacterium]
MKEKIYTIPINDAFSQDCECPLCTLEKQQENDSISFMLSPALMEPDKRIDTNEKGFCRRHFGMLYNARENVLGVSLIIETHIQIQMEKLNKLITGSRKGIETDAGMNALKNLAGSVTKPATTTNKFIDSAVSFLDELDARCEICERIERIMERYADVTIWMYFKDPAFMEKVKSGKGFCLPHYKLLLKTAKEQLSPKQCAVFVNDLNDLMTSNMNRILEDVQWFSQKFDYRNKEASWENSKDAIPRSIEKLTSYGNFK